MTPDNPCVIARRNAHTIKWLSYIANTEDRELSARLIEREYAAWFNLPEDEVKGALDYIHDQPSLSWAWSLYGRDIMADISGGSHTFS